MATYGIVTTDYAMAYNANWPVGAGSPPSDVAVAIASAMPSVGKGGQRTAGNARKRPGLTTYYLACALRHGDGNPNDGVVDAVFSDATRQPKGSNKTNNLTWLSEAGLITVHYDRTRKVRYAMLTDAGIGEVKLVSADLAKAAKGYTAAARDKALRALERANKPPKRERKVDAAPVEGEASPYDNEPVENEEPVSVPVEALIAQGFDVDAGR